MIRNMIRRWLGLPPEPDFDERRYYAQTQGAEAVLGESGPSIVAYRISNGFIVRTVDRSMFNKTMAMPALTYCKDHTEVAEHLIAEQARNALGVGHQYEMTLSGGQISGSPVGTITNAVSRTKTI